MDQAENEFNYDDDDDDFDYSSEDDLDFYDEPGGITNFLYSKKPTQL